MQSTSGKVAIVIGATGLVGQALVQQLAHASHIKKVIAITRKPVQYSDPIIENHIVNFSELEPFKTSFSGDILFSCLGTTIKKAGSIAAQKEVDVNFQYQAAKIAVEQGVQHYLLLSSSGANSSSKQAYFQMKGLLEDKITQLPFNRISIFRPSLLKGKRSDFRFAEKLSAPLLTCLTLLPWLKKYKPISGDKVARKMISISKHNNGAFELYELDDLFR